MMCVATSHPQSLPGARARNRMVSPLGELFADSYHMRLLVRKAHMGSPDPHGRFYLFLRQGNAALLDVELQAPAGTVYLAKPQNVAMKGRLNGLTVKTSMRGTWKFRYRTRAGVRDHRMAIRGRRGSQPWVSLASRAFSSGARLTFPHTMSIRLPLLAAAWRCHGTVV